MPPPSTNLEGWFQADAISASDLDTLASWVNSASGSLGLTLAQATSGNRPVYRTNQINSLPAVRFDNPRHFQLQNLSASSLEVFAVIKVDNDPPALESNTGLWQIGSHVVESAHYPYTDGVIWDNVGSTTRKTVGNPTPSLASWHLYNVHSANSDWAVKLNGTQIYSTATNGVSISGGQLVGRSAGSYYLKGYIAELLIYTAKLSDSDRTAVKTYIANKYNLTIDGAITSVDVEVDLAGLESGLESGTLTAEGSAELDVTGSELITESGLIGDSVELEAASSEVVIETGTVLALVGVNAFVSGEEIAIEVGDESIEALEASLVAQAFVEGEEITLETGNIESFAGAYSLFPFRPHWKVTPRHGQIDDHTFASVGLGAFTPWKPSGRVRRKATYDFLLGSREAIAEWQEWFRDRGQRLTAFWLPLYLNDYGLTEDASAGATELRIARIGLAEKFAYGEQFSRLALVTPGLDEEGIEQCTITAVAVDGDEEVITLESPLENDVDASHTICCGVMLARAAEDQFDLQYKSDSVAMVSLTFLEVPTEISEPAFTSKPIYLYQITRAFTTWRFAGWAVDLEAGGHDWAASDISHSEIASGIEVIGDPLELRIGTDDAEHPIRACLDPFAAPAEVKIYEVDADDLTLDLDAPIYVGRLGEVRSENEGRISAQVSSILRIAELEGPGVQIQRTCHHDVYDDFCGLDAGDFTTAGTIDVVSSSPAYVEVSECAAKATAESDPNWFAMGKVMVGTEIRFCVGQVGARLYLNLPFSAAVAADDAITALAGCDKRINGGCAKLNNTAKFLGFPYLPNANPGLEALKAPVPTGGKK